TAADRPGGARESDRLDRPPDDAHPRTPPHGGLRRLPRGPRPGRSRPDRARGDCRPRVGPPHRTYPRRLPPRDRLWLPDGRESGQAARQPPLRPALSRRQGADREPAPRSGARVPSRRFKVEPRAATEEEVDELVA